MKTKIRPRVASLFLLSVVLLLSLLSAGCDEQSIENVHKLCRPLEEALQQVTQNLFFWQKVAFVEGIAAVVLLLVGAALGSRAREEVLTPRKEVDHEQHLTI